MIDRLHRLLSIVPIGAMASLLVLLLLGSFLKPGFWFTPDQRAQRLFDRGKFQLAAETAGDPLLAGTAWFKAKEFKRAEASFVRSGRPEAWYNLGNARVFQGKYQAAVEAYDTALEQRPDWPEARQNREIARIRAERMKREGGEMGDQKLGADEIVFTKGRNDPDQGQETVTEGEGMGDKTLQAMWLRRLDTRPADFLKAKFAYQAAQPEEPEQ